MFPPNRASGGTAGCRLEASEATLFPERLKLVVLLSRLAVLWLSSRSLLGALFVCGLLLRFLVKNDALAAFISLHCIPPVRDNAAGGSVFTDSSVFSNLMRLPRAGTFSVTTR